MHKCDRCTLDVLRPDFGHPNLERVACDVRPEAFSQTIEIYQGVRCRQCERRWNNHGEMSREARHV